MHKYIFIVLFFIAVSSCQQVEQTYFIEGVEEPSISLDGTWKISTSPPDEFWKLQEFSSRWRDIKVPGECMMQGFTIRHDQPFAYVKKFIIPSDYEGKTIQIRFEGVYSYARVWVNGQYLRDHSGGFTAWTCDITPFVEPGSEAILAVEVTDKADEVSYASGYAAHPIGGILRNVTLQALPKVYPEDVTILTDLDDNYENAELSISGKLSEVGDDPRIELSLIDPNGNKIALPESSVELDNKQNFEINNEIDSPLKWDAEHPNLYKLFISLHESGSMVWQKEYKVGFREIKVDGNKLLVNGKIVKLRGVNRHDIHPTLGRVSTPDYELKDVLLAKEANVNFIRTSHYPPTENFLDLCDQYGLYVEDETAVCFVSSHRANEYFPGSTESDTAFTERYLSQLEEMVVNHKNHPSIIIWSIGNENTFGSNFKKSYDWVNAYDPSRPIIFSYPGYVPDSVRSYDILSMHYPYISGNMDQVGIITKAFSHPEKPALFDEWGHVPCYNNPTIIEDPNVRDFWGISLDSLWQRTFAADGGLGGAIWCMIDETFFLPDTIPGYTEWWGRLDERVLPVTYTGHTIGYGEWGIIDAWRRKKPEFWNTKKAYSPIRVLQTIFNYSKGDKEISIPVFNRFDHTNLSELKLAWEYNGQTADLIPPSIEPHSKAQIELPISGWSPELPITLSFYHSDGSLVDKYQLTQTNSSSGIDLPEASEAPTVEETDVELVVTCDNNTKVVFNKLTGQIKEIQKGSEVIPFSGPQLNLRTQGREVNYSHYEINEHAVNWTFNSLDHELKDDHLKVRINGKYDDLSSVTFEIDISNNGLMELQYTVEGLPEGLVRELGLEFQMAKEVSSISWDRETYWSYYPEDHLSARSGTANLYTSKQKQYGQDPAKPWNEDTKSFYYSGTTNESIDVQLTNAARASKDMINQYALNMGDEKLLEVHEEGDVSCRLAGREDGITLFINNEMDYVDLSWGGYQRNIKLSDAYTNKILLSIGENLSLK
ncbi:MAG: glycoside hydrolase family 2 TIM barrel-domain containing protein [Bacteroidota bacterium]